MFSSKDALLPTQPQSQVHSGETGFRQYVVSRCPDHEDEDTRAEDAEMFHLSKNWEPAELTSCSTIAVLPCSGQPVVLTEENTTPPMRQFGSKEVMDAAIASMLSFEFDNIATASVRLFGPRKSVSPVWRAAFPCAGVFWRTMLKAWKAGVRSLRQVGRISRQAPVSSQTKVDLEVPFSAFRVSQNDGGNGAAEENL